MKSSGCTLLFAEDDPGVRKLYEKSFAKQGFRVITCDNAVQVMAELRDEKIDLLVTDLEMPEANTLELFPFLKKEYPRLPVIVVSGHYQGMQDSFKKKGFQVTAFFNKPVETSVLSAKIREILKVDLS